MKTIKVKFLRLTKDVKVAAMGFLYNVSWGILCKEKAVRKTESLVE